MSTSKAAVDESDVSPGPGPVEGLLVRLRPYQLVPPTCTHKEHHSNQDELSGFRLERFSLQSFCLVLSAGDNEEMKWTHLWRESGGPSSLPSARTCQKQTKPTQKSEEVTRLPCSSFPWQGWWRKRKKKKKN